MWSTYNLAPQKISASKAPTAYTSGGLVTLSGGWLGCNLVPPDPSPASERVWYHQTSRAMHY